MRELEVQIGYAEPWDIEDEGKPWSAWVLGDLEGHPVFFSRIAETALGALTALLVAMGAEL